MIRVILLALLCTLSAGVSLAGEGQSSFVTGRVLRPDGTPAAGATVQLVARREESTPWYDWRSIGAPPPVTTGKDGVYQIPFPLGTRVVIVGARLEGCAAVTSDGIPVRLRGGLAAPDLQLQEPLRLAGQVVDWTTGRGVAGARVEVHHSRRRGPFEVTLAAQWLSGGKMNLFSPVTDEEGRFEVTGLPPGMYSISTPTAAGYREGNGARIVRLPQDKKLRIELRRLARSDASGRPLPPCALRRIGTARPAVRGGIRRLDYTEDSRALLSGGGFGIHTHDISSGAIRSERQAGVGLLQAVAQLNVGLPSASSGQGGGIRVLRRGRLPTTIGWGLSPALSLAFSPDGQVLASGHDDGVIRLWNLEAGEENRSWNPGTGPVTKVAYLPNGTLVSAGFGTVWIHSDPPVRVDEFDSLVLALAIRTGGDIIAAGGGERVVLLSARSGQVIARIEEPGANVSALAFVKGGHGYVIGRSDGLVRRRGLPGGEVAWERRVEGSVRAIAFSPTGEELAVGGGKGTITCLSARTGNIRPLPPAHSGPVTAVALSPDGRLLATSAGKIFLRDLTTDAVRVLPGHRVEVERLLFSRSGEALVSRDRMGVERTWAVASGECIGLRVGLTREERGLAGGDSSRTNFVSPDGSCRVYRDDRRNWFVSGPDERPPRPLPLGSLPPQRVVFEPGCKRMATLPSGGIQIIDIETGRRLLRLGAWGGRVRPASAVFAPDGLTLVTGHGDGTALVWDLSECR